VKVGENSAEWSPKIKYAGRHLFFMSPSSIKRKEPTWDEVGVAMQQFGWSKVKIDEKSAVFQRGRQKVVARFIPSMGRWKVEYFSGTIMDDTTGLEEEHLAKRDAVEMGLAK
jgi:hypothetical protein